MPQRRMTSANSVPVLDVSPICGTLSARLVGVAQLVRAPGCGPGGRGFETPRPPQTLSNLHMQRRLNEFLVMPERARLG